MDVQTGPELQAVTDSPDTTADSRPTAWGRTVGIGLGLAVLIGVLVTAFAWPANESAPRDVPVAVVGTADTAAQLEEQLATAMPDAFDLELAADVEAAREMVLDREVYGAIVLDPSGPQVLIASAASPVVAQILQGTADQLAQPSAGASSAEIEDVVPLPDDDPRGSTFTASALPMVLGGMVVGIGASFVVAGLRRRIGAAVTAAVAAGVVVTSVTQGWFGSLDGNYWANAGAVTLIVAAIAMTIIGLVALIGPAGIGVGAVITFLIGNNVSGISSAPEMLPTGWGALGQLLPAGAGGTLLRSTSFFDGAAAATPIIVLTSWLAAGLLLVAIGHRFRPASHRALAG